MLQAQIKVLNENARIPTKGSKYSAGYDLYSCDSVEIYPHETIKISTGLAIAPPKGYFGAVFARSGLATKQGLRPANCVGVCDEDYRGEYTVAIHNDSKFIRIIKINDRIAQLVFIKYEDIEFEIVNELNETERGKDGFGSTGN